MHVPLPLVQGGMGIGVSLHPLASAVAAGGIVEAMEATDGRKLFAVQFHLQYVDEAYRRLDLPIA